MDEPVAVVVAHSDDETIGLGASLSLFRELALIHVTDGAPGNGADARAAGFEGAADYAAERERELAAALKAGGVRAVRSALGAPDQGASDRMAELALRLAGTLRERGSRAVFTHPYEGGHPDHDAVAWCVHAAARLLARDGAAPAVFEMAFYHASPEGWSVGRFLPGGTPPVVLALDDAARSRKRAMLDCFRTQRATLAQFPVRDELVRPAPAGRDFGAPPHPGTLLYERFPWGMDGARWRSLAAEAGRALGLPA